MAAIRHPSHIPVASRSRPLLRHLPDPVDDRRLSLPLALTLSVIALGGAFDLILDQPTTWRSLHVIYEVTLIVAGAVGATWLWRRWHQAATEGDALRRTLAERQAEAEAWRASAETALRGMGEAIDRQFETWRFTPAERLVAFQLLRGLSHKEIAAATDRSERTVRQHAASAYAKAGLDGRATLAAYFLEGVRIPGGGG